MIKPNVRVLVCGSRDWTDGDAIRAELEAVLATSNITEVIHGAARGADAMAGRIAEGLGLRVTPYPADWKAYKRAAGPIRNRAMADTKPDFVLAFKDGFNWQLDRGGTENMVRIALDASIPCRVIDPSNQATADLFANMPI